MLHGMISLNLMLLLLLVNLVSRSRLELMYMSFFTKYQVSLHSSPWFSAVCALVKTHRNHFFGLCQQNKSSASKEKFRKTSNCGKRVLETAKLLTLVKQKRLSLTRNLAVVFCF